MNHYVNTGVQCIWVGELAHVHVSSWRRTPIKTVFFVLSHVAAFLENIYTKKKHLSFFFFFIQIIMNQKKMQLEEACSGLLHRKCQAGVVRECKQRALIALGDPSACAAVKEVNSDFLLTLPSDSWLSWGKTVAEQRRCVSNWCTFLSEFRKASQNKASTSI